MRDVLAGTVAIGYALIFLVPAIGYGVGNLGRPGAGGYPAVASVVLIILGLAIMISGLRQRHLDHQRLSFDIEKLRHIGFIAAAIAGFALTIDRFGLMPATAVAVVLSKLADRRPLPLPTLILTLVICLIVWAIFKLGLNVNVDSFEGL
mgnify:CR=1 FL=1